MVRTLRIGKYKYIRNYQPFNIDALFNFYRYKMLAFQEWNTLYNDGKLNAKQRQFFEPRGPEGLYNIEQDPHEVNDLSGSPEHQKILMMMRKRLQEKLATMPDLSFYPEPYLLEYALENPVAFGQKNLTEIKELMAIADLNLSSFDTVQAKIKQALTHDNPWKRYWGLVVCTTFGEKAKTFIPQIKNLLHQDDENLVRIRAAEYLMMNQVSFDIKIIEEVLKNAKSETEANLILNSV
ncbi:MAG: sulfatase, partial [Flavobacteriaceae bacterium]